MQGDRLSRQAIEPGVDNKESVARALGQPTIAAQWDDNIWYYLTRNTKQIAFARPRAKDQKVLIVHFDDKGNVSSVERRETLMRNLAVSSSWLLVSSARG